MEKTDAGSPVRSHLFSIGLSMRLVVVGDLRTDDRALEMPVCGERKMSQCVVEWRKSRRMKQRPSGLTCSRTESEVCVE